MLFRRFNITPRLWFILILATAGFVVLSAVSLTTLKDSQLREKQIKTRHLVESAHSLIAHYHAAAETGAMSNDEARSAAISAVKQLRYDDKEYFWINDMKPVMVMHPIKPALDGKDLSGVKDPNGKALFLAFVDQVKKEGSGFVGYFWPKPGSEKPVEKLSYVKGFSPWGWIIGSGVYIDDVEAAYWNNAGYLSMILGGVVVLILGVSTMIARSITQPLEETLHALENISAGDGDLTVQLNIDGNDEISRLRASFNRFVGKLHGVMEQVSRASEEVATAAEQLASVTEESAGTIKEQSDETDEVAEAVARLARSVQDVASNANEVAQSAQRADEEADHSQSILRETVSSIQGVADKLESAASVTHKLESDSENIGSILDVIRGIAEQTNLLALNAAIEAARAGEQGRGFAVVADEVRHLAQRTQESTHEIQLMIEQLQAGSGQAALVMNDSREETQRTSESAGETMTSLQTINDSITSIKEMCNEVAMAAEEESQVADALNQNVTTMRALAHRSSAATSQINGASHELAHQAEQLRDAVRQFRI
ncbi:methyl-accepting chemotaxis protein [Motiliproteus sediminis]|uniref:methyl-accepting chemotaxis protein n=1 Tax=Motiliproteus sediminis TaxID=1468178 RepID=UPI001AEF53D2|nr:methyl-accepting chemotaxis protein [Motiliproteus sediminis]